MNQLIGFTDGETTASYKYNASGLRYEKTVNGETINHVWDGSKQIVADVIDNQFYEADCYIRGTNLVAKYNYKNGDKSEYTYYTQNAHGDVVNLTNANGEVTKTYKYDAFGVEINPDTNDVNVFRFCGEYFDTETGTVYLRARYYQASIGRFISRDSYAGRRSDPLSLNLYTYCRNNPIRFIDPSGHSYATLPSGNRMSINSASDAKLLAERRKQFAESSSQVVTTAPQRKVTPITGGLAVPTTYTTTYTTVATVKTKIKENKNLFDYLIDGCDWLGQNVFIPCIDGVANVGKAVYHSTSVEIGGGFGFGIEGKAGIVNASLMSVPIRNEYIIADDCKTNSTSKFSINADIDEILGLGAEAKCSAYNGKGDGISWLMPGHLWEYQVGLESPNASWGISSLEEDPNFTINFGVGAYLFVGGDISVSFDVDEFFKRMGW